MERKVNIDQYSMILDFQESLTMIKSLKDVINKQIDANETSYISMPVNRFVYIQEDLMELIDTKIEEISIELEDFIKKL